MAQTVADTTETFSRRVDRLAAELAPAERRVAQRLVELGPEVALMSAAALADSLGTSDATVVRTAQSLGYRGLAELRHALVTEVVNPSPADRLQRTLADVPGDEVLANTIARQLRALDALTRDVPNHQFDDAVAMLSSARRVVWRGVGPSAALARYGEILTTRIGTPSSTLVHVGTSFADELLTLATGDAVVLLAYGRLQTHASVLLERAQELQVPVVVVTDNLDDSLTGPQRVVLRSGRGARGLFASHGATVVLIEALVLGMAAANRPAADRSLQTLNKLRAAINERRIDVDTP